LVPKTILIMAGGTGGHIFPGLAVAEVLAARGWRVCWMGVRTGMEAEIVPKLGYEMTWVNFQGVRGKGVMALLLLPSRLLVAFWQALGAIRSLRPDVVLSMGGYVALPGGMMASLLGRPLIVHEQNSVAGTTNRLLARLANRVLTSFENAFGPKREAIVTGNPIRAAFRSCADPSERLARRTGPLKVTILGGSLGAKALNDAVPAAVAMLPDKARPELVHQTGRAHIATVEELYRQHDVKATVLPFIDDVAAQLVWSDVVICRAGATTLAELAAVGAASVLIPFPFAIDDHQTRNARAHADRGAAVLLPQSELSPSRLAEVLRSLDRQRLLDMSRRARQLGRPEAAHAVAEICERAAGGDVR
jgi:UDP-N-acetylglucosamine--N-acetylmuramyl-(pentapeptide) pyrophosphoryl-undecaprenol N-acetylglucosamine transferase